MAGPNGTPEPPPEETEPRRRPIAWWWRAGGATLTALAILLLSGGDTEGDSVPASAGTEAPASVEGIWEFIVNVTETTGVCAGDEDEAPGVDNVTIWQRPDGNYAVTGLGTDPDDEWDGYWDGDAFVFSGEREEDSGTTVTTFRMWFTDNGDFVGDEDWSWSDNDGDCPEGASDVEAHYYGPLQ